MPMSNSTITTTEVIVALQGTIETFALPDVLRLLASTKKSGDLRLSGDRGAGALAVADGAIVGSSASGAPHAQGPTDVVFELLRYETGEFVFEDGTPSGDDSPSDVEPILADAEKLLGEWREIEAVIPSGSAWVALAADLPDDEVAIDRHRWGAVVAIGSGVTVDGLGETLSLGELPVARLVKDLSEAKLVTIGEAPMGAASAPTPAAAAEPIPTPTPAVAPDPLAPEPLVQARTAPAAPASSAAPAAPDARFSDSPSLVSEERFDPNGLVATDDQPTAAEEPPEAQPGEAAEIARQLANLSPKAARAVAAAAKATTEEERDAALAEVEEGDDQINRELLLKFLGTVN
jgi:hypothetical protein